MNKKNSWPEQAQFAGLPLAALACTTGYCHPSIFPSRMAGQYKCRLCWRPQPEGAIIIIIILFIRTVKKEQIQLVCGKYNKIK